jgi:sugar O-acyltransferase (sialic acid O-acetyltransferase NeuD family)
LPDRFRDSPFVSPVVDNRPLIFWGATGQAKVLKEFLPRLGWRLVALFDNNPSILSPFAEVPLVGGKEDFADWLSSQDETPSALAAIGGDRGRDRLQIQRWLAEFGCCIPKACHPTAWIAGDARIGAGCQILANSAVGTESILEDAVILNTSASVDHECHLGEGSHIGPGAVLCGCVSVGSGAFIGAGATVLPRLTIGSNTVVGAGSVVTANLPPDVVAVGNPARIIQIRNAAQ